MKKSKKILLNIVSIAASASVFIACLPISGLDASAETDDSIIKSSSIMQIDDVVPDGIDNAANPYGYGVDVPFLLFEQNELMMTVGSGSSSSVRSNTVNSIDNYKSSSLGLRENKSYSNINVNLYFMQAVAFDPNGSGRK